MGLNIVEKILKEHLVNGALEPGQEIEISINDGFLQDSTGTTALQFFEKMGVQRVQIDRGIIFIDHNTLQADFKNRDDHTYVISAGKKYGFYVSLAGNGICHRVFLERFTRPGKIVVGSDSHTPHAGGAGQLGIGQGGLEVASILAGEPYHLIAPKVVQVLLKGKLRPFISAKDIILELLRRIGEKGGTGKVFEYGGPGVNTLGVSQRATITNMGAETNATSSIFPSDEKTKDFLLAQGRLNDWSPLQASPEASYDGTIEIDLSVIEPLVACPHLPSNVKPVADLEGLSVNQVIIGSCTDASYLNLRKAAAILRGKKVHPDVDLFIFPGSRQVLNEIAASGDLQAFVQAGARVFEPVCGPCIGMGGAPGSGEVSLRTFNRNFKGRSGTEDAQVYLASPEVAAISAIEGKLASPLKLDPKIISQINPPRKFDIDDSRIVKPLRVEEAKKINIIRGPNIIQLSDFPELPSDLNIRVLIKVGDDVSTDDIMPAGASVLPLRSNLPELEKFVFYKIDRSFYKRTKESAMPGVIIGGKNYGKGSSREHAALAPRNLGIQLVIVKDFARIHLANLVNFGILPCEFVNHEDYDKIQQGDELAIRNIRQQILSGREITVSLQNKDYSFRVRHLLSTQRDREMVLAGGLLNWIRNKKQEG